MEKEKFIDKILGEFNEFAIKNKLDSRNKALLIREIADALAHSTNNSDDTFSISAPNAVVEVLDGNCLYRRYLELNYTENGNGIRLTGENMKGQESSIVFISERAIERMNDLRGLGPDVSPCEHE